jgi:hypothetical protein
VKPPAFKFSNGSQKVVIMEESAVNSVEEHSPLVRAEQDLQLALYTDEDAEI